MRLPVFLALSLALFAAIASAASLGGAMLLDRDLRRERAGAAAQGEMDAFLESKLAARTTGPQGPSVVQALAGPALSHRSDADLAGQVAAFRAAGGVRKDRTFLYRRGQAVTGSQGAWPAHLHRFNRGLVAYHLGDDYVIAARHAFANGDQMLIGRVVERANPLAPSVVRVSAVTALGLVLSGLVVAGLFAVGYDRRLRSITDAFRRIEGGEMSARAPERRGADEFSVLARRVNHMLDRVQRYVEGMRGVSDEIAHDLRTPLGRIQTRLASARDALDGPAREAVDEAALDARDLARTIDDFLWLREIEAGQGGETAFIGLKALCDGVGEDHALLAEEAKGVRVSVGGDEVEVLGVRSLLVRAVDNILANAVKFTPAGGAIALTVERLPGLARVTVRDNGPGMSPDLLARATQPGVRGDVAGAGHGLGLAIAASVARRHGGDLTLANVQPHGLRVTLDLPTPAGG
jgi:signal transduction histidine kinase